jgi:hypothetical protein
MDQCGCFDFPENGEQLILQGMPEQERSCLWTVGIVVLVTMAGLAGIEYFSRKRSKQSDVFLRDKSDKLESAL